MDQLYRQAVENGRVVFHKNFCVNDIRLEGNLLTVRGFMNVWDNSVKPPRSLPNLEFAHCIEIELDP